MRKQEQFLVPQENLVFPQELAKIFPYHGQGSPGNYVERLVRLALEEDGPDVTSLGVFEPEQTAEASLVAKQATMIVGLPIIDLVFAELGATAHWEALHPEGSWLSLAPGHTEELVAKLQGTALHLLKAERVILNMITHLSGIANLTRTYVQALEGTGVRLLDTRKTMPGQRYLEKYAVRLAGGVNHRVDLAEMLMLKDNHIDAAGSISAAVALLRKHQCPPLEIECRTLNEVREAVSCQPQRILLDNMGKTLLAEALPLIPENIEAEISGNVNLENIRELALVCSRKPDFISVGRITHSAPVADYSLRVARPTPRKV